MDGYGALQVLTAICNEHNSQRVAKKNCGTFFALSEKIHIFQDSKEESQQFVPVYRPRFQSHFLTMGISGGYSF